jgi:hypothetical protein
VFVYLQIIWNSAMRAELLNFVENQRMAQLPDGTYDMQPAQDFKYKALMNELHVGDVYLRVYNEQPELEVADGRRLCEALVDFISSIMEERQKMNMGHLQWTPLRLMVKVICKESKKMVLRQKQRMENCWLLLMIKQPCRRHTGRLLSRTSLWH